MAFVMGQCPECKKILPVDEGRKIWVCGYCNVIFSSATAINDFNKLINIVQSDDNAEKKNNTRWFETFKPLSKESDFEIRDGKLMKYKGKSADVVIPEGVVSICNGAFQKCEFLESVTIPESVTDIESSAFEECISLESIVIPDSVKSLGRSAFSECISLKSVKLSENLLSIGEWTFNKCTSLKSIVIPENVKFIKDGAFRECEALESVTIPKSLKSVGMFIFAGCKALEYVKISKELNIDIGAFRFGSKVKVEYY